MDRKKKILVVYNHKSSWVIEDVSILSKNFQIETYFYKEDKNKKSLSSLIKNSDIIYIWFASYHGLKAVHLAKKHKKKIVTVASGYSVANLPEYNYGLAAKLYTRWIPKYIIKNSDIIIAVSESNKIEILKLFPHENIVVIPHGFDVEWFKPNRKKENIVITVGSLDETSIRRKGIDKFVEIAKYFPNIPFIIVGRINIDLKKFFKEIPRNIKFTGFVSNEELLRWYQKAKVYAQFSFHEAFGCSVAEAMLCSCIPVVTDRYALPEVVGNCGFIIPYWEEKKTIEAIEEALKASIKFGKDGRERIVENFSMRNREKNLIKVIRELE